MFMKYLERTVLLARNIGSPEPVSRLPRLKFYIQKVQTGEKKAVTMKQIGILHKLFLGKRQSRK